MDSVKAQVKRRAIWLVNRYELFIRSLMNVQWKSFEIFSVPPGDKFIIVPFFHESTRYFYNHIIYKLFSESSWIFNGVFRMPYPLSKSSRIFWEGWNTSLMLALWKYLTNLFEKLKCRIVKIMYYRKEACFNIIFY